MGPAYKQGGYGKSYGYGMGYGQGAAPAASPAEAAASGETTESASVNISQMRFNAPTVKIRAGGTVTWTNSEGVPHTVTATDGSFASEQLTSGGTFSHTFDEPGTYTYFCQVHPMMKATVVVEG
jgi:amicyanin